MRQTSDGTRSNWRGTAVFSFLVRALLVCLGRSLFRTSIGSIFLHQCRFVDETMYTGMR